MYHIVGGGLAGTFLAARLLQAGAAVTLWEGEMQGAATRVAAGLFNVITGRFGAKTWEADTLLHELKAFLAEPLFASLQAHVRYTPIYRPFTDISEYNKWTGRTGDEGFSTYVSFQAEPIPVEGLKNPHGGIWIQQCGWIDAGALVRELQSLLVAHLGLILRKETYQGEYNNQTILCSGWRASAHFPAIIPNKGDILRLYAPEWRIPHPISRKIYIIPQGNDEYVVGSTYEVLRQVSANDFSPSEAAKAEILSHVEAVMSKPYQVIAHDTGIRPTTPDRRPVLGKITSVFSGEETHIFSGFGTKGLLASAYTSQLMADFLLHGKPIPLEISASRFRKNSK